MELRGNTTLISGASGFVGGHVARRLAAHEGMRVRALVRNPGGKTVVPLKHENIELVKGDLLDKKSLSAAFEGVNLVFHSATDTRLKEWDVAWATSVDGTRNMYEASRAAGSKRFIFMSSYDVYFGLDHYEGEDAPVKPYRDLYGDSKIEAEQLLLSAAADGPEVIIFRAPSIYGPGGREWTIEMMVNATKGRMFLPGGGFFPFPYVYIDNLVDAVVMAARADTARGVYNVVDGQRTYKEFTEPYCRLAGRKAHFLPSWLLRVVAIGAEGYSRLTGKWVFLSRRRVKVALMRNRRSHTSADKFHRDLGWVPRIDFAEGMKRTEEWLRESGYIT